jgi:hypothetical protein
VPQYSTTVCATLSKVSKFLQERPIMNKQITALTLTLSALTGLSQAASAQEGHPARGARFDYAPNVWKGEEPNKQKEYSNWSPAIPAPNAATVRAGSVPRNMLGLPADIPIRIAPRVAPMAQTALTPSASFASAVPVQIPTSIPAFKPAFGKGLSAHPKAPLSNPPAATARTAPAKSNAAHPNRPLAIAHSVSAKIFKPHLPVGHAAGPANGLPPVASYGNQGYTPGTFLPSVGGNGSSSVAQVSGKITSLHRP